MFWWQKIILISELAQKSVNLVKEIKEVTKRSNGHKLTCKCNICKNIDKKAENEKKES